MKALDWRAIAKRWLDSSDEEFESVNEQLEEMLEQELDSDPQFEEPLDDPDIDAAVQAAAAAKTSSAAKHILKFRLLRMTVESAIAFLCKRDARFIICKPKVPVDHTDYKKSKEIDTTIHGKDPYHATPIHVESVIQHYRNGRNIGLAPNCLQKVIVDIDSDKPETNDRMHKEICEFLGADPWLVMPSLSFETTGKRHLYFGWDPDAKFPLGKNARGKPHRSANKLRWGDDPDTAFDIRQPTYVVLSDIAAFPPAIASGNPPAPPNLDKLIDRGNEYRLRNAKKQRTLAPAPSAPVMPTVEISDKRLRAMNEAYLAAIPMPNQGEGHGTVAWSVGCWVKKVKHWNTRAQSDAEAWLRANNLVEHHWRDFYKACEEADVLPQDPPPSDPNHMGNNAPLPDPNDAPLPRGEEPPDPDRIRAKRTRREKPLADCNAEGPPDRGLMPIDAYDESVETYQAKKIPEITDYDAASMFMSRRKTTLHYEPRTGKWLQFDPKRKWNRHAEFPIKKAIGDMLALAVEKATTSKEMHAMRSSKKINAVYSIVKTTSALPMDDGFHEAPGLVGLKQGKVYEFESRTIRDQRPTDRITKVLGVFPDKSMKTPFWDKFQKESLVDSGGAAAVKWMNRFLGYCLTDQVAEEKFAYIKGAPGCGKSTSIKTWKHIFGEYCCTAPTKAFIRTGRHEEHPTALARLDGFRLVLIPDAGKGRFEDENTCKFVSGDPMSVRYMQKDYFDMVPVGKLIVASTQSPVTGGPASGVGRRMDLLTYPNPLPKEKRDKKLLKKLKKEAPGILWKLLEQASDWYEHGLLPVPSAITEATEDTLSGSGILNDWADECLGFGPEGCTKSVTLRESYIAWLNEHDSKLKPLSAQAFKRQVSDDFGPEGVRYTSHLPESKRGTRGFTGVMIYGYSKDDGGSYLINDSGSVESPPRKPDVAKESNADQPDSRTEEQPRRDMSMDSEDIPF